jgi:hypothetical protein
VHYDDTGLTSKAQAQSSGLLQSLVFTDLFHIALVIPSNLSLEAAKSFFHIFLVSSTSHTQKPTPSLTATVSCNASMSRRAGATNAGGNKETAVEPQDGAQSKQAMLLSTDTGHFSLIKALHLADLITEMNGKHSPLTTSVPK